ncbi:MAG: GNAT family N-acetyltransferase [Chloroflexi bacterium]|nr:GNAT family N-acetyltransferase [Chloroflexota bacterium]
MKQLDDGLILRSLAEGTPRDKTQLSKFYLDVFIEAYGPEDEWIGPWADDLLAASHPTVTDDDVWVVIDPTQDDRIVSALLLIPQTWRYETLSFGVGRVELVATHKDYRDRGLVRELFAALHARSKALGHSIQAITGIPYFYRQFGYAMAVDLGTSAAIPFEAIPELKEDEAPFCHLRPATEADIPAMMAWEEMFAARHLLSHLRPQCLWEYEMTRRNKATVRAVQYHIIVDKGGRDIGYITTERTAYQRNITFLEYAVGPEASYLQTYDDVLRSIRDYALNNYEGQVPYYIRVGSGLYPTLQPLLEKTGIVPPRPTTYSWYIRVPDMVQFLTDLKPILEQRLSGSLAHRYTGELKIQLYSRRGLYMRFEDGCIVAIDDRRPEIEKEDAAFPYHTFLNVVFGHRTVQQLAAVLPDVGTNRKGQILLDVLFPPKPSWLVPLA